MPIANVRHVTGELFRQLQLFRASVQSRLLAVRPSFASEPAGTLLVTRAGLEFNYLAHDAALHAGLAAVYEHLEQHPPLQDLHNQLKLVNDDIHKLAFDIVVEPFAALLAPVPQLPAWGQAESTAAPSAYITQLGELLLLLPQHLELFLVQVCCIFDRFTAQMSAQDSSAVHLALKETTLPFTQGLQLGACCVQRGCRSSGGSIGGGPVAVRGGQRGHARAD